MSYNGMVDRGRIGRDNSHLIVRELYIKVTMHKISEFRFFDLYANCKYHRMSCLSNCFSLL